MPETLKSPDAEPTCVREGVDFESLLGELNIIAAQVSEKAMQRDLDFPQLATLMGSQRELAFNAAYWAERAAAGKISPEGAIAEFRSLVEIILRTI